jgi:hypothetical protein
MRFSRFILPWYIPACTICFSCFVLFVSFITEPTDGQRNFDKNCQIVSWRSTIGDLTANIRCDGSDKILYNSNATFLVEYLNSPKKLRCEDPNFFDEVKCVLQ